METPIVLSLGLLTVLLIHFASSSAPDLITRGRKRITSGPILREETPRKKNDNKHGIPTRIFIPNVFARWPWPRRINPNYAVVKEEADTWIAGFEAFSPKAQDAYNRCNFNLLACLAFPSASKGGVNADIQDYIIVLLGVHSEHVRSACDLMHVLYMFDEYSDRSTPSKVREQRDVIMDALRNPHMPRPKGEWIGGEVTRQFWERTIQNATPVSQKRFIQSMDEYLEEVVQESIDKDDHRILDIKSYINARRRTGAVKPSFSIIELGFEIPDEVMSHPVIQEIVLAGTDMITFSNDIVSYNLEQRRGDELHNMVSCVMNEYHTDVNGAMLWIEDFLLSAKERFRTALAALPKWEEPLNSQVKAYCDGIGQWVRANDDWSFEGERYFGSKGLEIKENRWMSLLPKKRATEIGPVHIDSSLLL